mmetsp:Transcript_13175/g.38796  ORF Transcript_13175/g.38796 Transcript_13175/m.38796 type:complete len:113 (-) Transcript_13175:90-428(-)
MPRPRRDEAAAVAPQGEPAEDGGGEKAAAAHVLQTPPPPIASRQSRERRRAASDPGEVVCLPRRRAPALPPLHRSEQSILAFDIRRGGKPRLPQTLSLSYKSVQRGADNPLV